jgi:outer membrane protein
MRKTLLLACTATLLSASALVQAHEAGDFIFRAGVGVVEPKSDNLSVPALDATVQVDSGTSLTLTGAYMMTDNWAFEVLAAWPFKHDIDVDLAGVGTAPLGETEHLPPTFSLQYHFAPDAVFQPYVGLGVNYTTFFSEEVTAEAISLGITDLSLDDSFGLAAQIGADWILNDRWLVNFDARWINIESDATVTLAGDSVDIGTVKIDPYVLSIEVGYRF